MAFTLTELAPVFGTNDDNSTFSTASYTFTAGAEVVVVVFNPGQPTPSINGFTRVTSQQNSNTSRRITFFESDTTPANGPIVVTFPSTVESCNIWAGQIPDGYGTPLVRQAKGIAIQTSEPIAVTFDNPPLPTSTVIAAGVGAALNDYDYTAPFVEQSSMTTGTPPMGSRVGIAPGASPTAVTITPTGGTIHHGVLLVELQAAADQPVARLTPNHQQQPATGEFEWDATDSTGNALSYLLTILDAGTTGATNGDIVGATTTNPTLPAAGLTPGDGTVQLTVTDAASQTATTTANFTVVDAGATLVPYLWDATNEVWVQQDGAFLWDGAAWT